MFICPIRVIAGCYQRAKEIADGSLYLLLALKVCNQYRGAGSQLVQQMRGKRKPTVNILREIGTRSITS